MRLTNILCQLNYHRHTKRIWKKQGRLQTEALVVPPALVEMGVPILDAKEILQETKLFPDPKPTIKTMPLPTSVFKQEKCFYVMHYATKVSENENQTLSLTKTVLYQGLPPQIASLAGRDSLPNQDELVQTSLLQALVWDADQCKLPKVIDITRPGYIFRRSFGVRNKKKVIGLLEKLTNLCDCASGKYSDCLDRLKLINSFSDVTVSRNGEIVAFKLPCDIMLTSKEPLKRFSSLSEVQNTENETVPDIYPIKFTLDLDKVENISDTIMPHIFNTGHLHTIFVAQKSFGFWFPKQILARAIATCFSFTASKARQMYGENVAVLPEPICVQCVYSDIKTFNFITYQLNTLDLDHNEGIKNQVWIDEPSNLYESVSEGSPVVNYNPNVFPKLLGMYLNGLCKV